MIRKQHAGAMLVEFAIVVPVLILIFFAGFEFCRVAMVRHTVDNAVYAGCRVGSVTGATAQEAESEARRVLRSIGVDNAHVEVTPEIFGLATREVSVSIEVPLDQNSLVPNQFVSGKTIRRELTLRREGIR
ncbi:MAG: pilus assembly protein [Rubripirellula sp.]|jgi:Flp pilus assembly protein TadG|nr:pilus assembly protein [Rubripirellula sp.]